MFKKLALKPLLALTSAFMAVGAFASTSTIESYHQVLVHPSNGSNIYVQVDVKTIDGANVSGYDQFYANAVGNELRQLNTGERLVSLTCFISTDPAVANGAGGPEATFSFLVETGRDYELYPHVYEIGSGAFSFTLCNPGIRPK